MSIVPTAATLKGSRRKDIHTAPEASKVYIWILDCGSEFSDYVFELMNNAPELGIDQNGIPDDTPETSANGPEIQIMQLEFQTSEKIHISLGISMLNCLLWHYGA